jgi:hypothetical protein
VVCDTNTVANAIGYAEQYGCSHDAVIRVYDEARDVIETHEHAGDLTEWKNPLGNMSSETRFRAKST